ncbi:hypothetical protein Rsub_12920 [Raphidocelis subcapitata]|uniref:Uncharacterized protein n=1 Tax=Raphidocelis subcapitata TaxID=307507 RepID=A0A2V0PJX1_9CHLO|nr:hypothetical protein Rsub_12920 [Raphidocelis subcapitata]|eukprot:GBG00099.1 hypothetical protein Rsub_12920 [Raphidocelis subcapitata]
MAALVYNRPRPSPQHGGCSLPFDDWELPSDLNGTAAGCWERAAWPCGHFPPDPARKAAQQRLAYLIQPQNEYCAKLASDVRRFKSALLREDGSADAVALAARLAGVGHACAVRTAIGAGPGRGPGAAGRRGGAACPFKNLRHVFLAVAVDGGEGAGGCEYLVDANFKEHFLIPHPTLAYLDVLSLLPEEFVGSKGRLAQTVACLCAEMSASFEARGLTLPPWRREAALASKWLPQRSRDTAVGADAGTGAGASPPVAESLWGASSESDCDGGSPDAARAAAALSGAFSRLDDEELLQSALERRASGRGLLSDKLGGSPSPRSRRASAGAGAGAGRASTSPARRRRGDGAGAGDGDEVLSFGAAGVLSRQPPVWSGQPATWKAVRGGSAAAPRPQAPAQGAWQ